MDKTEQTRFKLNLIFIVFIEGIITAFVPAFPFVSAISAQGGALGVYTVAKTVNNTSNNSRPEAPCATADK